MNIREWIDSNGLVKPQQDWTDSGNGVFYSALYLALRNRLNELTLEDYNLFYPAMQACQKQPGLLMRTPTNDFGQESHDNILGMAVGMAMLGSDTFSRDFIRYGTERSFFFDTDGKFDFADFMGRFPHEIFLIHELGYRTSSPLVFGALKLIADNLPCHPKNESGFHLSYMFQVGCWSAGQSNTNIIEYEKELPGTTERYFGPGHPIIALAKRLSVAKW